MNKIISVTGTGIGLVLAGVLVLISVPFCLLDELLLGTTYKNGLS